MLLRLFLRPSAGRSSTIVHASSSINHGVDHDTHFCRCTQKPVAAHVAEWKHDRLTISSTALLVIPSQIIVKRSFIPLLSISRDSSTAHRYLRLRIEAEIVVLGLLSWVSRLDEHESYRPGVSKVQALTVRCLARSFLLDK